MSNKKLVKEKMEYNDITPIISYEVIKDSSGNLVDLKPINNGTQ